MGEEYVDTTSPRFLVWVNDRFREYRSPEPDPDAQPCLGSDGRVKRRGAWDTGPTFSTADSSGFRLMPHQRLVRDFMAERSPYRGLLLYHAMGSGKTCTAIAVTEASKSSRTVVVLCPASLRDNFVSELRKCGGPDYAGSDAEARAAVDRSYYFVAYDAPNLPEQLARIPDGLNDKLLVVDECHGLVSMVLSASVKGRAAFRAIMEANNLRVLLMSGTPVVNDPFEIGIIANLLTGYVNAKGERLPRPGNVDASKRRLLFNDMHEFVFYFVSVAADGTLALKNRDALMRRLTGLVSYFGGVQPRARVFPTVREHVVTLRMSAHQFDLYARVRRLESEGEQRARRTTAKRGRKAANVDLRALFSTARKDTPVSSFRAFSRQFSNFAMPEGLPRPLPRVGDINAPARADRALSLADVADGPEPEDSGATYTAAEERMLDEALAALDARGAEFLTHRLPEHSPKMAALLERLATCEGPAYVYSQFRRMEGIGILALVLKAHGMIEYGWRDASYGKGAVQAPLPHTLDANTGRRWGDALTASERAAFQPLTYMFWPNSADGNTGRRSHLLRVFNSEANEAGRVIRVFLSTKSGAEGLNLMNVRQVHVLEPYWNTTLVQQAIGRAVRMCSHATLPEARRHVDVYHYVTTVDGHDASDFDLDVQRHPRSTDEYVLGIAQRKAVLTNQLLQVLKDAAFDCRLNHSWNRMAGDVRCYDFRSSAADGKAFTLDLSQERTDKDLRTDTRVRATRLHRLRLKGVAYRVDAGDVPDVERFAQGLFKAGESRRIPLYHDVAVTVVATLALDGPRTLRIEPVGA